ncbi:FG-GAP-like repeat-containing protein [Nannocystaceae bacterium ST9]
MLAAVGCEDPEAFDDELDGEVAAIAEAPLDIEDGLDQQAAGAYPTYTMLSPVRADDLKPNHYVQLQLDANKWDDLVIRRYAGGWSGQQPGTSGEQNQVTWGTPVYSGVDGEVIACWRTAPYDDAYEDVDHMLTIGGNFIVIKTTDGKWVYHAHLDTNTIPSSLCPIVSTNVNDPGYMNPATMNVEVCDDEGGKECSRVENYIPAGSRPQVHAGQFIGRMGAVGNAKGAHLHMDVGTVNTVDGIDRMVQDNFHIVFERTWQAASTGATPPIAWTAASGMSIPNAVTTDAVLLWSGGKHEDTYSGSSRMADFDGDGSDDLLCHDTSSGTIDIDFGVLSSLAAYDFTRPNPWCSSSSQRLHAGDFDGDGSDDLLCHDIQSGDLFVDYAGNGFASTDYPSTHAWCNGDSQQLRVGDFDGDGKHDLLCHDHANGNLYIDLSAGGATPFAGTQYTPTAQCSGHYERLHVGKFDGDAKDDLVCHDTLSGARAIDRAGSTASSIFAGPDLNPSAWCMSRGQRLFVANVDGTGADDFVCHDSDNGKVYVDTGSYGSSNWSGAADGWCTSPYERLKLGDANGDGLDDLVCHHRLTGGRMIDYSAAGEFNGTNFLSPGGDPQCEGPREGLH